MRYVVEKRFPGASVLDVQENRTFLEVVHDEQGLTIFYPDHCRTRLFFGRDFMSQTGVVIPSEAAPALVNAIMMATGLDRYCVVETPKALADPNVIDAEIIDVEELR